MCIPEYGTPLPPSPHFLLLDVKHHGGFRLKTVSPSIFANNSTGGLLEQTANLLEGLPQTCGSNYLILIPRKKPALPSPGTFQPTTKHLISKPRVAGCPVPLLD